MSKKAEALTRIRAAFFNHYRHLIDPQELYGRLLADLWHYREAEHIPRLGPVTDQARACYLEECREIPPLTDLKDIRRALSTLAMGYSPMQRNELAKIIARIHE